MDSTRSMCRKFKLTLISATDVANRGLFRSKIYAKVSFSGKKKTKKRTPADKHNGTNPAWNHTMRYRIAEKDVVHHGLMLVIKLYRKGMLWDRYVGQVHLSVKELFDYAMGRGGSTEMWMPVLRRGGVRRKGMVRFSYRFGKSKRVARPCFLLRVLKCSACFLFRVLKCSTCLLRVAVNSTTGVDVPTQYSGTDGW